jgi:antitoxin VapB
VPLSIKNEQTERLARQVAEAAGESITTAIRHSLEERLARLTRRGSRSLDAERVREILRRVDALPVLDSRSPDEILGYNEDGLPE